MKYRWLIVVVSLCILAGTARADLTTDTFDGVKTEVETRNAALPADPDKAQKKLAKAYKSVLKAFAKESTGLKKDCGSVKKIVATLFKAHPDDAALKTMLQEALGAFLTELGMGLSDADRGIGVLGDENKKKAGALKARAKADDILALATAEADLKKQAGYPKKYFGAVGKAGKATLKALKGEDLTKHQQLGLKLLEDFPNGFEGTKTCLVCHADAGTQMLTTSHWLWEGVAKNMEGHEGETHGKADLINNFCIAIPSNEGRCTQCHAGIGWKDTAFDFSDVNAIDCLICHDASGLYSKDKKTAGAPVPTVDLQKAAMNAGHPTRTNCGKCHFFAGGGDNVKHGDLASTLNAPTKADDVHMGTDGQNFACQKCHTATDHRIAGSTHLTDDSGQPDCTTCHPKAEHPAITTAKHLDRIACQTCHIPTYSRSMATKLEWYWSEAGDAERVVNLDENGKPDYDKMKGRFVWGKNVKPELMWHNGKWNKMTIGTNDKYTSLPVDLGSPVGSKDDVNSMIHPFKKMIGNQAADKNNKTMLVPHLFGMGPGPNPYWVKYVWETALAEGAAYAGQTFTGEYEFVETFAYLALNHEIAPKAQARGCNDCHNGGIDFTKLGYSGDPMFGSK